MVGINLFYITHTIKHNVEFLWNHPLYYGIVGINTIKQNVEYLWNYPLYYATVDIDESAL